MEEMETRVIYHLEDQDTPYLIRINVPAQRVTLADFKRVLNKPNLKFFFKSVDDDFGLVTWLLLTFDVKRWKFRKIWFSNVGECGRINVLLREDDDDDGDGLVTWHADLWPFKSERHILALLDASMLS